VGRVKIYISGAMSGLPLSNFPAFHEAEAMLRQAGFDVVNPARLGEDSTWDWSDYLKRDLVVMFDCDAVATLDGWVDSRGAWLEVSTARALGMSVRPVSDWCVKPQPAMPVAA
jgi:hypothetical protein